jgi:hypothetical protein
MSTLRREDRIASEEASVVYIRLKDPVEIANQTGDG